jgi:hypothetical protein
VAIYDTFNPLLDPSTYEALAVQQLSLTSGWTQGGGTSTATQVVAAIYALAGNGRRLHYAASLYTHSNQLFDVTTGSNGDGTLPSFSVYPLQDVVLHDCGTYLCRGEPGYDGPTGNGTPDGLSAF